MSKSHSFSWTGRTDTEDGEAGHRWHNRVTQQISQQPSQTDIAIYGYQCDKGVAANKGRIGAVSGPDAIRAALANTAWHLTSNVLDAGDTHEQDQNEHDERVQDTLAATQTHYSSAITALLANHKLVIGLGGGHDIAWGSYQGLFNSPQSKDKTIGVINFDAHFDLRIPAPNNSSGTPFYQVAQHCKANNKAFHYACLGVAETSNTQALYRRADELKVIYLNDLDCELLETQKALTPMLREIDELYVTICLDAFSADKAPGASAPSAIGICPMYVIQMIQWLAENQQGFGYRWRLADIAEMNPRFDIDGRTAKLAARLIHEICKAKN